MAWVAGEAQVQSLALLSEMKFLLLPQLQCRSQLKLGFRPWSGNFQMPGCAHKRIRKKKKMYLKTIRGLVSHIMVPRLIQQLSDGIRIEFFGSIFLLYYPQGICLILGLFLYTGKDGTWNCSIASTGNSSW